MKFGEAAKVSLVGGDYSNALPTGADRDQGVIRQSSLSDFFVMILGRQAGQDDACLNPIAEVRNQDSFRAIKVSLQSFHNPAIAVGGPSVKFFEHDCA